MTPEIKQTLELIFNVIMVLFIVFLIVSYWVQKSLIRKKNRELKRKSNTIKALGEVYFADWKLICKQTKQIAEYKLIMDISDDISAEMLNENERLQLEVDTLKAKLNHKKRPINENTK